MVFQKKKIQVETLSEYLVSVRTNLKLSLEQVSRNTGIKLKLLLNLERGEFKALPADVYVFGFLKQLAQVYVIDQNELIKQYKKEKGILEQLNKQPSLLNAAWYKKYFQKVVVTPKGLSLVLGVCFVLLTFGYIVWQLWSINKTPSLTVTSPLNNAVVLGAAIEVDGHTDPGASLSVNNQNIFVDSSGNFKTQVSLSPGPREIVITATNRFGKSAEKRLNITGVAAGSSPQDNFQLKMDFTGPVVLDVSIDGQSSQSLTFLSGDSKTFTARQKIVISTSDAGATKVTLNGQNLGAMGRPKEQLQNVPFFVQADMGN